MPGSPNLTDQEEEDQVLDPIGEKEPLASNVLRSEGHTEAARRRAEAAQQLVHDKRARDRQAAAAVDLWRFNTMLAGSRLALIGEDEWRAFKAWSDTVEILPGLRGFSEVNPDDYEESYVEVYTDQWKCSLAYQEFEVTQQPNKKDR